MPAVPITSREQYIKAIGVLTEAGGTWHGVGPAEEPYLLVNLAQYQALMDAGVAPIEKNGKATIHGKKTSRKRTKP